MAVAITIVLVAIAIVAHVPNAHVGQPRHFRASVSVLVVCTCILGALVMSLPKTASCTDMRSSFALLRFDTVPFCCARWLSWCLNPTPMVALPNSKWTLAHCSARSGHFAQLEVAQLEVGTCRRERNSKRTLAQTLAQLRNLLKWTLADTCSSVTLAHLDSCSHGLHWTLATTRPTTTTTTNDHGLDPPPSLWSILLLLST